ncbi:unnamed protein product [Lactuca virosa]|uniref:Uncharacterized protein n=1 Tax=Lactuca virosa TaxID=75947 RepID=A0AAU9MRJ5_9ASTR|nr:unnamed protein product [Lactuca virosa]
MLMCSCIKWQTLHIRNLFKSIDEYEGEDPLQPWLQCSFKKVTIVQPLMCKYIEHAPMQVELKFEHRNSKDCNSGPQYEWQLYMFTTRINKVAFTFCHNNNIWRNRSL